MKLKQASVSNVVALGLRSATAVVTVPVLFRTLGQERYGQWIFVSSMVGLSAVLEGGNSVATTVSLAEALRRGHHEEAVLVLRRSTAFAVISGLLAIAILGALAGPLAAQLGGLDAADESVVRNSLIVAGAVIATKFASGSLIGALFALDRFVFKNAVAALDGVGGAVVVVVVAKMTGSLRSMMISQLLLSLFTLFLYGLLVQRSVPPTLKKRGWPTLRGGSVQRRLGFGNAVIAIGVATFQQMDRLLVGNLAGDATLGAYGLSVTIGTQMQSLIAVVSQPLVAALPLGTDASLATPGRLFVTMSNANAALTSVLAGVLLIAAHPITQLIGREESPEFAQSLRIATAAYAILALSAPAFHWIIGKKSIAVPIAVTFGAAAPALLAISFGIRSNLTRGTAGNLVYGVISLSYIVVAARHVAIPVRSVWRTGVSGSLLALAAISAGNQHSTTALAVLLLLFGFGVAIQLFSNTASEQ